MSNSSSPVSTNSDAFTWIGSTGGAWGTAANWDDTTAKKNPATTVPGSKNSVTVAGSTGSTYEVITGGGAAASVGLTNQVDFAGTYTVGGLTVGSQTLVPNGSATFATGNLALGNGSTLKLTKLNVLDGQMTVGAGAIVTASGAVSLGQPSESGIPTGGATTGWSSGAYGALTVNGGGSFTASGAVSVVQGALDVDGSASKASVGSLQLGSPAVAATATSTLSSSVSSGSVSLTNGGSLTVGGAVTDYDAGSLYLYNNASFVANGSLTFDVSQSSAMSMYGIGLYSNSTMRVANLTVADPTSSGQSLSIDIYAGPGQTSSFEVGTKGGAAAQSITVDAGASIASTAGLSLSATSIVDNGTITETGGTLHLDAATSGSGTIALGADALLDIGASETYNSSTNSEVYTPYAVSTAISGFAAGDGLLLDEVALTKAVYASTGAATGTLKLYAGATLEDTLTLAGQSYAGDTFFVSPTTNAGSEVSLIASSGVNSPVSTNSDAFTWIGSTGGAWGTAANWDDTTAKKNPATTVPGSKSAVTVAGSTGSTYEVITGGGAAASVGLTNQVDFAGTYTVGGLTVGSQTLVPNGSATFATGNLALGNGSTLKLTKLNVLDGQMTVGAGAIVTASGAVSLGQPSESGIPTGGATTGWSSGAYGALTVNGGGSFTASGAVSVVQGALDVDGSASKASVGSLQLGSPAVAATATSTLSSSVSSGSVSLTNGGSLTVGGAVTDYDAGSLYLYNNASFVANGSLTFDVSQSSAMSMYGIGLYSNSTMRVANLTVADPTSSGQSLSIDIYAGPGQTSSFEVGTKGGAAAQSITVDAGASIASTAGLSLSATSIVDNGTITETGGTLHLDAATSGSGTIALGADALLDIGASETYNSSTNSEVYTPYAVSTAISGFAAGDGLLLDEVALTKAVYASTGAATGTLKLYAGATLEDTLTLAGQSYAGDTFFVSPTTNAGSEVSLIASSGVNSPVSTNSDAFTWIGSTGGAWGTAANWDDTTAKKNPATTVPGSKSAVTVAGSTGSTYEVITGGGAAASVGLTNQVDFAGTYTVGGLTVGSQTLVPNGSATFATGNLALGNGSTLKLTKLNVLDGQMTVGAGAVVTASGAVSLGQPSESGIPTGGATTGWSSGAYGALTVNGGGSFTASGAVSVVQGALDVDGSASKASVGSLQLGSPAVAATATSTLSSSVSSGSVSLTNGGSLKVGGAVTDYDAGSLYLYNNASFVANGSLTFDVSQSSAMSMYGIGLYSNSTMRVANLTVADPTSSGQSLSIDIYAGPGQTSSFEVGTKGGAAAQSITVDAGASIASTAGLSLSATSIVDNGTITETGGTLHLDAATSGSGTIALGADALLDIGASETYNSSTNSEVYTPYAVSTAISGFAAGDGLLLDEVALTKAVYASTGAATGTLKLYAGATLEDTLTLAGQSYAGDTFFVSPTTNAGSEVSLLTASSAHA